MNRKEFLSEKVNSLDSEMKTIKRKLKSILHEGNRFDQKIFNKSKKLMKKLVVLSDFRESLMPEYIAFVEEANKEWKREREEKAALQKQKEDAEWEEMCNNPSPSPKPSIVVTKEMISDFIKKTVSSRNICQ